MVKKASRKICKNKNSEPASLPTSYSKHEPRHLDNRKETDEVTSIDEIRPTILAQGVLSPYLGILGRQSVLSNKTTTNVPSVNVKITVSCVSPNLKDLPKRLITKNASGHRNRLGAITMLNCLIQISPAVVTPVKTQRVKRSKPRIMQVT